MNKRRLLLFSVFALLHITTSEHSFIDGKSSDQPLRSLSPDTRFSRYETHQVRRFLTEIGQLNKPEKCSNCKERDTELTHLSRRRQIGFISRGSRDSKSREIVERHDDMKRILTNPTEEIHERRDFRERIRERCNALRNDFRRNRFSTHCDRQYQRNFEIPSWSRNGDRINDVTRNRLENGDMNRHKYINRDSYIRNTRDNRNEVRREAPKLFERNAERYTVSNDFDYVKYTESYESAQNSILERAESLGRNIRTKRSDRINVFNRLANDRNRRLGGHRHIDEDLSQNESSRKSPIRKNVSEDSMRSKHNKRRSFSDNQINRRLARLENIRNIAVNEFELKEKSRLQREYTENTYERATRRQSERSYNLDRIDVSREKENRISIRSRSTEEKYLSRDGRNDARFRFDRRSVKDNTRYTRGTNQRDISEEREKRINIRLDRNHEYINSRGFMERNIFESRLSNKIRSSESSDNRDINENRLSVRRSHIGRALETDNEITDRRNLQTKEFRDALRRSEGFQLLNINDASDRMGRRNREALSYSPEIRKRDDSRRNIRESQYDRSIENRVIVERGDRQQSDKTHETINERIRNNNLESRFKNQFRFLIRQDQNRILSKTKRNVVTVRSGIQIAPANIENELRHRSRSLTRVTDDESRLTRKTQERPINIRRTATLINERRESMMEFSDSRRSMFTHKIKYENQMFEMKWQYLFYALHLVYLCSILIKIPKDNDGNKHKRFTDWFTSAEYIKID